MSKYNIKITVVTPTNIPCKRLIEINFRRSIMADNLRKMLYKIVNFERDFTEMKHLNVEIENGK